MMSDSSNPTPQPGPKTVEDLLAGTALEFFNGQSKRLHVVYYDLVHEGKMLEIGHKAYEARYPGFKPVARMLNKEWLLKDGEESKKKLAKMMEKFEMAGGEKEHAEQVKNAFEHMLEKVQRNKMKVFALRNVVGQYRDKFENAKSTVRR